MPGDVTPRVVDPRELGADDTAGTGWHPSKPEHYTPGGLLPDLTDEEVAAHQEKPEAAGAEGLLAAEDSTLSPDGVV